MSIYALRQNHAAAPVLPPRLPLPQARRLTPIVVMTVYCRLCSPFPAVHNATNPAPSTGPLSAGYITARDTPLSQRSPIVGLPLRAPAPLSPAPPPAAPFQPTSTVAPPPSAASLSGPLPRTPIVALPLSGPAIPAPPTACILDVPQGREAALPEAQIPSRASIVGNSSSDPNVTITEPLHIISVPHGRGNEDGHVTPPAPVPDPQREVSTGPPPNRGGGGPPPSDLSARHPLVQTKVADSQPQPLARKRNWFQKFVWDYKKDKE
ncbi:hypothetical protein BC826DRAFT_738951 [Russula brevipes]|nr:hypothetical protein BC826DRAFT_738951 [Russula brevipes]